MYLYETGANLYDRNRFAPVLFHFFFTGLPAGRREFRRLRERVIQKGTICIVQMFRYLLTELPKLCDRKENIEPAKLEHLLPWVPEECKKPCR